MKFEVELRVERPAGFALDVRFACESRALAIVGPSGSGKSTLLDAIAGIEPAGRVVLDGRDLSRVPLHLREVGYVTQEPLLFPHRTVRQNLKHSPRARDVDAVARSLAIDRLLDRMPRHLSGGEKRRVALARAIVARPRVLLLDEPFGGLDETRRREAMSLLDQVRRAHGVPMVLVSHLADEVIGLTDFAIRLEEGRVAATGPSASVLRAAERRIDNYFDGEVVAPDRVRVEGGAELVASLPPGLSGRVRLACYASDVLLAAAAPASISARNVVPARVAAIEPAGDALLVELAGLPLRALVTRAAVDALALRPGEPTVAILKATSITYLGAA